MDGKSEKGFLSYLSVVSGIILGVTTLVYFCGFVIINAHLSTYHFVEVQFVQPAFLAAGLLFFFIVSFSYLPIYPVAAFITGIIDEINRFQSDKVIRLRFFIKIKNGRFFKKNIKGRLFKKYKKFHSRLKRNQNSIYLLILVLTIIAAILSIYAIETISGLIVGTILTWAARLETETQTTIKSQLMPVLIFQAISALAIFILAMNFNKLKNKHVQISIFLSLCSLVFIFVQTYSLLYIAGRVYENIPANIGGGRPERVILLIRSDDYQNIKALQSQIFPDGVSFIQEPVNPGDPFRSEDLLLFWQLNSSGKNDSTNSNSAYVVRLADCQTSPVFQIPKSSVYSIVHVPYKTEPNRQDKCMVVED